MALVAEEEVGMQMEDVDQTSEGLEAFRRWAVIGEHTTAATAAAVRERARDSKVVESLMQEEVAWCLSTIMLAAACMGSMLIQ